MKNLTIPVKCASDMEAARKSAALVKIAANMDADGLAFLATLSAKPGANAKLVANKSLLLSLI